MSLRLLAISPGPLDKHWLPKLMQLLPLGSQLGLLFRDTSSNSHSYFQQAGQLAHLCQSAGVAFFVHRRPDVALALQAHLHLPSYGFRPSQVRHLFPQKYISTSVHNEKEALLAKGADFALVSPVFSPGSKPHNTRPLLGVEGFSSLASTLACPAWALGGISPNHLPLLPQLQGVAAVSSLWHSPHPLHVAKTLLAHWNTIG